MSHLNLASCRKSHKCRNSLQLPLDGFFVSIVVFAQKATKWQKFRGNSLIYLTHVFSCEIIT